MDGVTAVVVVGIGLACTLLIGIAAQRRSHADAPRAAAPAPPPVSPRSEAEEDLEAVSRSIEEAREELLWLREQVARERARLERLRRQAPPQGGPAQGMPPQPPQPATTESPWAVLGLAPGASAEAVRQRYRLLSRVWHPDRFVDGSPDLRAEAELMMAKLNRAYQALTGGRAAGARKA